MTLNSNIIEITRLDYPELQPYRSLRRSEEHWQKRIFVAEGEKVVRRLLTSDITIVSFLLTHQWYEKIKSELQTQKSQGAKIFLGEKKLLESIVGYHLHQGIMAIGIIPPEPVIDDILNQQTQPKLFVAIDGLVNAENVGIIVRNCAGFGVDAIIVGETSSSPYLRRAVRNSMGTVFRIPVIHSNNLKETLINLNHKNYFRIIGAHPSGSDSITDADLTGNLCIIFGNEDTGISKDILSICTETIAIPMINDVDSLNVANASAIFLYEARKQRKMN